MPHQATVLRVLIASPSDATEERAAIPEVIRQWNADHSPRLRLVLEPVLWETHTSPEMGDRPQAIVNRQIAKDCDFLIAFFWTRLGTPSGLYASGTVEEIEEHLLAKKPTLLYFSEMPVNAGVLDTAQLEGLRDYKATCENRGLVFGYDSIPTLRALVASHLTKTVDATLATLTNETLRLQVEIDRNAFLREIVVRINEFELLSKRCTEKEPRVKKAMASYFWRHYLPRIADAGIRNLFFESGSTIAYLSAEFRDQMAGVADQRRWHLRTNNILTYLQFVLFQNIKIDLFPSGIPENTYGATFGPIGTLRAVDSPAEHDVIVLPGNDKKVLAEVAAALLPYNKPSLLLGTASGLELREKFVFPGPHVGSYHNKLFKRAMLSSPHPLVLFLDSSKVSPVDSQGEFKFSHCHPVCDNASMWEYVYKSVPLAFCIGGERRESVDSAIEQLQRLDFEVDDHVHEESGHWIVVLRNKMFKEAWGRRVDIRRWAVG